MQVTLWRWPLSRGATVYTPTAQFLFRVWALMYTCHQWHTGGSPLPLVTGEVVGREGREGCGEVGVSAAQGGRLRSDNLSYLFLIHSLILQKTLYIVYLTRYPRRSTGILYLEKCTYIDNVCSSSWSFTYKH